MHPEERAAIDCLWQGKDCIETSAGLIKGDHVVITDGFLKGRESLIKEIRPRRREAVMEIEFMEKTKTLIVGLDILKKSQ